MFETSDLSDGLRSMAEGGDKSVDLSKELEKSIDMESKGSKFPDNQRNRFESFESSCTVTDMVESRKPRQPSSIHHNRAGKYLNNIKKHHK